MSTETPCSSRCVVHAVGAAPAGVEQRAQVAAPPAAARSASPAARALAQPLGRAGQLAERAASASSSALMRWRSGAEKPAARTALARKTMASSSGARQSRAGARRARRSSAGQARAASSSSIASSQCGVVVAREQQREQLAQVGGVRRARQQARAQALAELAAQVHARREAEVGEQRGGVDLAPEARQQRAAPRSRCSALRSSTLSRWRRRSTGVRRAARRRSRARAGAWRSHSSSRTSHRWRSASARLRVGGVEQRGQVPGRGGRRAPSTRSVQRRGGGQPELGHRRVERAGRPRSCRRRCRASCRAAWRCASSWCTRSCSPGLSSGWWPTTARPRTSSTWPSASVMIQWRAISCAVTSPLLRMVTV